VYSFRSADNKFQNLNFRTSDSNDFVFGTQWLSHFYTIFDFDHNQVLITPVYLENPDSPLMDETTRWLVVSLGSFFFIVSIISLLVILQPIS